jgi:hypothetical protein
MIAPQVAQIDTEKNLSKSEYSVVKQKKFNTDSTDEHRNNLSKSE